MKTILAVVVGSFLVSPAARAMTLEQIQVAESPAVSGRDMTVKIRVMPGETLETKQRPSVEIWRTSGNGAYPRNMRAAAIQDLGDRWYGITVTLSPYQQSGDYCLAYVRMREIKLKSSDSNLCGQTPQTVYEGTTIPIVRFSLSNPSPDDVTEPVVSRMYFKQEKFSPGQMLRLYIEATDGESGIDTDKYVLVTLVGGGNYFYVRGRFQHVAGDEYVIKDLVRPGGRVPPGQYLPVFFQVYDRADNMVQYDRDTGAGGPPFWLRPLPAGNRIEAPSVTITP